MSSVEEDAIIKSGTLFPTPEESADEDSDAYSIISVTEVVEGLVSKVVTLVDDPTTQLNNNDVDPDGTKDADINQACVNKGVIFKQTSCSDEATGGASAVSIPEPQAALGHIETMKHLLEQYEKTLFHSKDANRGQGKESVAGGAGDGSRHHRSRSKSAKHDVLVLMDILVRENRILRKRVKKLDALVHYIMSKYRSSVASLLNELDHCKTVSPKHASMMDFKAPFQLDNEAFEAQVAEMKEKVREASKMNELVCAHSFLNSLLTTENEGLRELVEAANKIGCASWFQPKDESVQTEDETNLDLEEFYQSQNDSFFTAEGSSASSSPNSSSASSPERVYRDGDSRPKRTFTARDLRKEMEGKPNTDDCQEFHGVEEAAAANMEMNSYHNMELD